jgi:aldehyde dehydrogenase (NAD+)
MTEEIFGPLLPILTVDSVDDAISFIERRAQPLAIYCFTRSAATARHVERSTTSGAFCQNTTIEQVAVPGLPFGGVGASGSGSYHGRAGFETFSRRKSVLLRGSALDFRLGVPPYTAKKRRILAAFLRGPKGSLPLEAPPPNPGTPGS